MYSDTPAGTDSGLLAPTWAGTPVEAMVTDEAWLRAMLDVEVALVRAQAKLGFAPAAAAEIIATVAATAPDRLDLVDLARQARAAANPVVAFVVAFTELVAAVDRAAAEYVHRGSTSQDVLDSATMLIASRVLAGIDADLSQTAGALAALADEHRHTVLAGRTLARHAVPTTFGLKAAGWLHLVEDAQLKVIATRRSLPAQLGGAAGTLAAYQEYAVLDGGADANAADLIAPFAAELDLAEPTVPWHTARTPIADLGSTLALVSVAIGKFALDVQTLSRTEITEVDEPAAAGRGASSAMPQKRNPVLSTLIITAARQVPAHALVLMQSVLAEDERPGGAWHAEWQPLREALRLAGGAAHTSVELAEGLTVRPERMAANLRLTDGAIMAERLNVALAPMLGKAGAKKALAEASARAERSGQPFEETLLALLAGPDGPTAFDPRLLPGLLDPARYVGPVDTLIDRALGRCRRS